MPRKDNKKGSSALKASKRKYRTIAATAALAVVAALSILFSKQIRGLFPTLGLESIYSQAEHYPLAVYFADIGSGGCTLIHTHEHDVLIDCGQEKAQESASRLLHRLGTDRLSLAVLTHPDSDHIGSFPEVIEKYGTDRFLTTPQSESSDSALYAGLTEALRHSGVPIENAKPGDEFEFDGARLEVIAPLKEYKKDNDSSVVLRLEYGEFTALFTGDISKKAERDILESGQDISADVLLVAHHGSGGSSSEEFLRAVSPRYAVIEVEESAYLPNGGAIERLAACGCDIYRTDISGTIAVFTDGTDDGTIVSEEFTVR